MYQEVSIYTILYGYVLPLDQEVSIYTTLLCHLLRTRSEEREVLGIGSIPVEILPSCQYMKILHYNCTDMNMVW